MKYWQPTASIINRIGDRMSELEIEMNNSIIDLIYRLERAKANPSPQGKINEVEGAGVQLASTVEFWNCKLDNYKNGI